MDAGTRRLDFQVDHLNRLMAAETSRTARTAPHLQLRTAKIVSEVPPDAGDADDFRVWKIHFVDATYENTAEGSVPVDVTVRSETDYYAAAPQEFSGEEDQLVIVARINDRWWILAWDETGSPGGGGDSDNCCTCICLEDATVEACSGVPKLPPSFRVSGNGHIGGQILDHVSLCSYESDTFNITLCGVDYGDFHWELEVAEAIDAATLMLVSDGNAAEGVDGTDLEVTYKNKWHFDPLCGTKFGIIERWTLGKFVANLFPCEICLVPDGDICPTCGPCATCYGLPVFEWDGEAWQLLDECDCADPDVPTEPASPGTFVGELQCGTCTEGTPECVCGDSQFQGPNGTIPNDECIDCNTEIRSSRDLDETAEGSCVWESVEFTACGFDDLFWRLEYDFDDEFFYLTLYQDTNVWAVYRQEAVDWNCSAGATGFDYFSSTNAKCDWDGASITVE